MISGKFRYLYAALAIAFSAQILPVSASDPGSPPSPIENRGSKRPNIIFVLTDDQDLHLDSLNYQPLVKKHLLEEGTLYRRHFCTIAICCPSRVNLWTGKAAHNTNVTDVMLPYGGYPKFVSQGLNEAWLPVWLQEAGYNTYYTGKLFNAHTVKNYNSPYPAGFTGSDFLLDPFTYQYLNATYQRNKDAPVNYAGKHTTDVLAEKTYGFLDDAMREDKPFFLAVAPVAPHSNFKHGADGKFTITAPVPLERHKDLFKDVKVPRTDNFNPEMPGGVNWISRLPRQNQTNVDYNDEFHRLRLRSLQGVDEIVEGLVKRLSDKGILDNTYIIYTTDNGFHIGQHRMQPGKECGYEEDINVPLIIRGPGVPKAEVTDIVTTHTDLVPTIFSMLEIQQRADFDGAAIPLNKEGLEMAKVQRHEHVNVEYWGFALEEGEHGLGPTGKHWNNTYKAIRVVGEGYNLYYSVWCSGEHELYDLSTDPHEVNNLLANPTSLPSHPILGKPLSSVVPRLDALLLVLKSCKADTCIHPWKVLHPKGNVGSLKDALNERYDNFYEKEQRKVEFTRCELGYILGSEGPQDPVVFKEGGKRDGLGWSEWV